MARPASRPVVALEETRTVAEALDELAEHYDVEIGYPNFGDDDGWQQKLEVVADLRPELVSFTFGAPSPDVLRWFGALGMLLFVTVTSAYEAGVALAAGADGLVVQGPDAGGHRGTFAPDMSPGTESLTELLQRIGRAHDIPLIAAVTIYSVEGLAGLGGRIAFGLLGDRFGAKRVLVLGLLAQAFGALAYVFVRELAAFYAVAALFGFIYAGTMPLYAVLARENFPLRMMGTVIGGTAMAGSLGMATGPLAGGLIYDTFASYAWLYIGSWIMGLGAFLIALTFRPFPTRETQPAPMPA